MRPGIREKEMKVFDIYEHPRHGVTAIKNGFSWSAFLAPSVWAAAKGLGAVTLMLIVGSTLMFDALKIASDFVPQPAVMLVVFVLSYVAFGLRPGIDLLRGCLRPARQRRVRHAGGDDPHRRHTRHRHRPTGQRHVQGQ